MYLSATTFQQSLLCVNLLVVIRVFMSMKDYLYRPNFMRFHACYVSHVLNVNTRLCYDVVLAGGL